MKGWAAAGAAWGWVEEGNAWVAAAWEAWGWVEEGRAWAAAAWAAVAWAVGAEAPGVERDTAVAGSNRTEAVVEHQAGWASVGMERFVCV